MCSVIGLELMRYKTAPLGSRLVVLITGLGGVKLMS